MESEAGTQTSTPSASPAPVDQPNSLANGSSLGTVIPNRIFVGGIDNRITRNELRRFFSQFGTIKEVNIVIDRAGVSKGYGFVTFENQEDAQRVLHSADRLTFRDKRLNIGQAIRKQLMGAHRGFVVENLNPSVSAPTGVGTAYLTTSTGCPYTYHNGVAYFHMPELNSVTSYWPAAPTVSGSPFMVTQPTSSFYAPQTFQQYQHSSQCASGHLPYSTLQAEVSVPSYPNSVLYIPHPELMYHPVEIPAESGYVQSALPLVETAVPEEYKFHPVRRGFAHSSVYLKPRYGHGSHHSHLRKEYRPNMVHTPPLQVSSPGQELQQ